jgi:hypothetical protein
MSDNLCDPCHKPRTTAPNFIGVTSTLLCQIGKFDVYSVEGWKGMTMMVYIIQVGDTHGWYVYRQTPARLSNAATDKDALFTRYTFTDQERDAMEALLTFKGL